MAYCQSLPYLSHNKQPSQHQSSQKPLLNPLSYLIKQRLDNPLANVYVVVPDHWLVKSEQNMVLDSSPQVHHLAGLSLASEVSRLAPAELIYQYRIEKSYIAHSSKIEHSENQTQRLHVKVGELSWLRQIQERCYKRLPFTGVISLSDCLQALEMSASQLAAQKHIAHNSLSAYQIDGLAIVKKRSRWRYLLSLVISSQLIVCSYYYYLQTSTEQFKQQLAQQQARDQDRVLPESLTSTAGVNLSEQTLQQQYQHLMTMIPTLPTSIRFNGLEIKPYQTRLDLVGIQNELNMLLTKWRAAWPEAVFSMQIQTDAQPSTESVFPQLATQTNEIRINNRTRSVQHVIVTIRPHNANSRSSGAVSLSNKLR
ncbi:hypothetical protein CBF23_001240 [Marinomonas agarivorans]|nr:hypothetical protein CBF23_001240 [Marinomonas agarivorans]